MPGGGGGAPAPHPGGGGGGIDAILGLGCWWCLIGREDELDVLSQEL